MIRDDAGRRPPDDLPGRDPDDEPSMLGPRRAGRATRTYRPFARQRLRELDEWLEQQRGRPGAPHGP